MEGGLAQKEIQQRRVVSLNEEEEYLLERYVKQGGADDDMVRIGPDVFSY